ncbi:MAG: hypothetical protein KJ042_05620, partial [Deltaproteobacteria bacterium]|nr:hypothetical protein [Deltaproteobacteria bacterium]
VDGNGVMLTSGDSISFAFIDTEVTYSDTPEVIYLRLDASIGADGGAFVDFSKIDDSKSSEITIPVYNFGLNEGDEKPSVWDGMTATFCEAVLFGVYFQLDVILDMFLGTSTTSINGVVCAEDVDLQNNEVPDLINLYVGGDGAELKVDNIRINYQF